MHAKNKCFGFDRKKECVSILLEDPEKKSG
jgi:hypothetical protein